MPWRNKTSLLPEGGLKATPPPIHCAHCGTLLNPAFDVNANIFHKSFEGLNIWWCNSAWVVLDKPTLD
jgi:hypothetical protein